MLDLSNRSIDLVVTSPPYWNLKDYGKDLQIGFDQSLHEYLKNLYRVWQECYRVLSEGTRLCINIGDEFLRTSEYGRYRIIPIHAEIIGQCVNLGFDYLGSIIWQKKTTMNTTGGANVMGSYPYPPNGLVELDYEYILIFKKPGKRSVKPSDKQKSKLTKEEWKSFFSGHWNFGGTRQDSHIAMFPEELPRRLIKMYSFYNDIVLDPFLGSGTTMKVALEMGRRAIGYELNDQFLSIIEDKLGICQNTLFKDKSVAVVYQRTPVDLQLSLDAIDYTPSVEDVMPVNPSIRSQEEHCKVVSVINEKTLALSTGTRVQLLGVDIQPHQETAAIEYLEDFIRGKQVRIRYDKNIDDLGGQVGYVYLKNKICINKELIKRGLAELADYDFEMKSRFERLVPVRKAD